MRRTFALTLALLAVATPARAAGPQVGIADDRILLAGGPTAEKAVAEWRRLGVQQVRIYALWRRIAPSWSPRGVYAWDALDQAVNRIVAAGMKPMLTITGPGPRWTSRRPKGRYDPDPELYARFARMVAERYGERVDRYLLWNEPNLNGWLWPQASCRRGRCTATAPHRYRALARGAYAAVHAADSRAQVLIGSLFSRGSDLRRANVNQRPLEFLRGLACVDASYRRIRSRRCKRFKPLKADGFAFHPHGTLTPPWRPFQHRDEVGMGSLSRLTRALDRLQRMHRLKPTTRRFSVYIDEFGYQTRPPDALAGVTLRQQDRWLQWGAYEAWRHPRVKLFSQYLWRDEPKHLNKRRDIASGGWQSGLRFAGGRAKPSLKHFATPFVVDAARRRLWGQVRRRDARTVEVQRRTRGSKRWRTIARRRTDAEGYWSWRTRLAPGASYRYHAAGATSATVKRR
ncbi:MAG TPA: hypothetical protein VFG79_13150 [Solirubrobacter sp.]|nr:hypothetical protein [Solirubrobacter sp.]